MGFLPAIPVGAKQTNCWQFAVIWVAFWYTIGIISAIASGVSFGTILVYIIQLVIIMIILWHTAWTHVSVSEYMIEVTMGPLQWPILRWFFSSQLHKDEILLVEHKQRECFYDVFPRFYCAPVVWCCCHKSYNSYFWPCCCFHTKIATLCDGDSDTSSYLVFYLTKDAMEFAPMCFRRCAPCPLAISWCWCCVYNRVAVSINPQQNLVMRCENMGYALRINTNVTEVGMAGNDAMGYNQMQDTNDGMNGVTGMNGAAPLATQDMGAQGDMGVIGNGVENGYDGYNEYNPPVTDAYPDTDVAEDAYRPPV